MRLSTQNKILIAAKSRDISKIVSENNVSFDGVTNSERDEIETDQNVFQLFGFFVFRLVINIDPAFTSEMRAHNFVDCHELIATGYKLLIVIRIKFDCKYGVISCISVC
jgi:hypothetical protein